MNYIVYNLNVSLTFSIHAYLFFLPSVLLQKFSVLSPDFPRISLA